MLCDVVRCVAEQTRTSWTPCTDAQGLVSEMSHCCQLSCLTKSRIGQSKSFHPHSHAAQLPKTDESHHGQKAGAVHLISSLFRGACVGRGGPKPFFFFSTEVRGKYFLLHHGWCLFLFTTNSGAGRPLLLHHNGPHVFHQRQQQH